MALIKTSEMRPGLIRGSKPVSKAKIQSKPAGANSHAAPGNHHEKAAERIAAASEQLAAGLVEAAAAVTELGRAMAQIAAGAEQATAAAHAQLTAVKTVAGNLEVTRAEAGSAERRTAGVQVALTEAAVQINTTLRTIEANTARQQESVAVIVALERRAKDIGDIALTVSRISDQTNLLALNAAIEAARAGDDGRGFAVVAEEVRALAETSESSAAEVQGFTQAIQSDVLLIVQAVTASAAAATAEAKSAGTLVETLEAMRLEMAELTGLAKEILTSSVEVAQATLETQRGAEQVAAAAQQQSAAAGEVQKSIQEQSKSLDQGQAAARMLADLADGLLSGGASTAHQIGSAAEQLSATLQQMSGAAGQITVAVDQINRGSQLQASATQQISAALASIEKSTAITQTSAAVSNQNVQAMTASLKRNRESAATLAAAVSISLEQTQSSLHIISDLERSSRRIERIVERIGSVAVQTTMLAVSGAVEAARAGDAGRGFAIVSSDIRSLAREATASADQVRETIRNMIEQLGLVRRNLEHIIGSAAAEAEKSRLVFAALDRVYAGLGALDDGALAILQGTAATVEAIMQTAVSARQIAGAAEQSNIAAAQAAITASEQAQTAEDLAAAI
jgi:methyl-accepting chemotaxis protein